jgi:hypothetical protein
MTRDELMGQLEGRIASAGGDTSDRFPLMQTIKEAAKAILSEFADQVDQDDLIEAALMLYDKLAPMIDIPGVPEFIEKMIDRWVKGLLEIGIRQAFEMMD